MVYDRLVAVQETTSCSCHSCGTRPHAGSLLLWLRFRLLLSICVFVFFKILNLCRRLLTSMERVEDLNEVNVLFVWLKAYVLVALLGTVISRKHQVL